MIRSIVDTLATNAALEVPVDAITAVVVGLNGLLESLQLDSAIVVINATNTSIADSELGADSECGKLKPSIKSSSTTIEGGVCPMDLFDEGEELAKIMVDAIDDAVLKALFKHVPGESPLEVTFSSHVPLSRSQPC